MSRRPNQNPSRPSRPARLGRVLPEWLGAILTTIGLLVAALLLYALLTPSTSSRQASRWTICRNNLHQIGHALHNYHDDYGSFPPAFITDADDKPLHSWRVLILPYLDAAPLYEQYRWDEPWNGPNNRRLAAQMPSVYRCPSREDLAEQHDLTTYCAITGPGTAFDGSTPVRLDDIRDGVEQQILIVDAPGKPVHWMQPDDSSLEQLVQSLAADLELPHKDKIAMLVADGAVKSLTTDVPARQLRALTTIAGDDRVDGF